MKQVRRAVRKELHDYLDMMLRCEVQAPNGDTITMLDDCCVRAVMGFGFSVAISCKHPDQPEVPAQDITPMVELARIHAPTCTDPACDGACMRRDLDVGPPPDLRVMR